MEMPASAVVLEASIAGRSSGLALPVSPLGESTEVAAPTSPVEPSPVSQVVPFKDLQHLPDVAQA